MSCAPHANSNGPANTSRRSIGVAVALDGGSVALRLAIASGGPHGYYGGGPYYGYGYLGRG